MKLLSKISPQINPKILSESCQKLFEKFPKESLKEVTIEFLQRIIKGIFHRIQAVISPKMPSDF